jgi:hypothetical protein
VLALAGVGVSALDRSAVGNGGKCFMPSGDLAASKPARWQVAPRRSKQKVTIALDHFVNEKRVGTTFVALRPTKRNRHRQALPKRNRVGAFVLGGTLSDGSRDIGFPVVAKAVRSRDGRGLNVKVCAMRPKERKLSRPGRYTGFVRVAGPRLASADIPVLVTIRAAQPELVLLAVLGALLGAALGAANSKDVGVASENVKQKRAPQAANHVLRFLPFVSGFAAGMIAALTVYSDNPTFGAHRGADTARLLIVTFTAATAGLAVTATPARVAREKLPKA